MNTVALMGRLTADPELKHTPNGIATTSFTIAVDRHTKEKQTDFIRSVAWRQTAELICKYFYKGKMIAVTGSIQVRNYKDRDGNNRTITEEIVDKIDYSGDKSSTPQSASSSDDFEEYEDISDQDLPFGWRTLCQIGY